MVIYLYPGYQRFCRVCDGELRFVGSRPTHVRPKAEDTRKSETETGNRAWKASDTQGNILVESTLFLWSLLQSRINASYLLNAPSWLLKLDRRPELASIRSFTILLFHLKLDGRWWLRFVLVGLFIAHSGWFKSLILHSPLYDVSTQNGELMLQWPQ